MPDDKGKKRALMTGPDRARVHILMGSSSDMPVASKSMDILKRLEIPYAVTVASAHRTPDLVQRTVEGSAAAVFIAIAGLSAALPGVVASHTMRPVIGVPVSGKLNMDSILSIVQMPPGVPVGGVGLDRGDNAALLAARMIAISDPALLSRLKEHWEDMRNKVISSQGEVLSG
ncbi:MAG: 5-(carboxyamino)imidazole ribonucleotide mutase [Candidatus Thermoplasmatota archaeon]|nr:5-(carboxyamino)imidazole ribonucleotide mutase [Candidatus Thermoplasmatota archaeon]